MTYSPRYLETGTSAYDLQPWVWMIMLGFGPFISGCLLTQFLYVGVSSHPSCHKNESIEGIIYRPGSTLKI